MEIIASFFKFLKYLVEGWGGSQGEAKVNFLLEENVSLCIKVILTQISTDKKLLLEKTIFNCIKGVLSFGKVIINNNNKGSKIFKCNHSPSALVPVEFN